MVTTITNTIRTSMGKKPCVNLMDKGPWPVLFQRLASATAEYGNLASGATKEDDDVARARALLARLANGKESATGSATNENQAPSNMAAPMGGGQ